jgi:hypothetical protein
MTANGSVAGRSLSVDRGEVSHTCFTHKYGLPILRTCNIPDFRFKIKEKTVTYFYEDALHLKYLEINGCVNISVLSVFILIIRCHV